MIELAIATNACMQETKGRLFLYKNSYRDLSPPPNSQPQQIR